MRAKTLSRRHLLRGLGVSLGLPALEAMFPRRARAAEFAPLARARTVAPRMLFCYVPNGKNIHEWQPKTKGRDYQLSPTLEVLKAHREDFTVISGLGHPRAKGGHAGADTWLTGADLSSSPGLDYRNSISVDQIIAEVHGPKTRFSSLELAAGSGTGSPGHSHTLAFDRVGTALPADNSPLRVFRRLFVPDSAEDRSAYLRRLELRRSLLDSVMAEARALHGGLGNSDRKKLDEYLTSVRATEARLERAAAWVDVPKAEVDGGRLRLTSDAFNKHDRSYWLTTMLQLCYLAFVTDATRVITFEWSHEASGMGDGDRDHHELSHHGGDKAMLERLAHVDRFHVGHLGKLLELFGKTTEGPANERMLDRTMILYGCGMDSGEGGGHSPKNLPLLVAGGRKLGFKHGSHLAFDPDRHPPLSNLLLTLAQKMGVKTSRFQDSTGPLALG